MIFLILLTKKADEVHLIRQAWSRRYCWL